MKRLAPLNLSLQVAGHLVVALMTLLLWSAGAGSGAPPVRAPADPPRFTTRSGMLAVTVEITEGEAPRILSAEPLAQGRASVMPPGTFTLAVRGAEGTLLYRLPFYAEHIIPGLDRPQRVTQLILVVPGEGALTLEVSGPGGATTYALE